jgi:hypothetical protein
VLRPRPVLLLALAVVLSACGGATESSPAASRAAGSSASATPGSSHTGAPGTVSPQPGGSDSPSASIDPGQSGDPSAGPGSTGSSTAADACGGTQANRDFFVKAALTLPWPVLCVALPATWYLSSGSYHLAGGGTLTLSYKGPGGAIVDVSEGSFCADGSGCVPPGTDAGDASLGARAGTFVNLDDGGFAVVVDRGLTPSWLFVAHGLDAATAKVLAAAAAEVAG